MAIAWDVDTAGYAEKYKYIGDKETDVYGLSFKSDGLKMYILGYANDTVYQYTLSTAWDVSTSTYTTSKSVRAQDEYPFGVAFNSDGTKMYIVGGVGIKVYQYTLSTGWDVSTATYADKYKDVSGQDGSPTGVFFKDDGTKMYLAGFGTDTVYQYTLSTPWDVSTATYDTGKYKDVGAQDTGAPIDVFFKPDGTKMYVTGITNDKIYQYTLSTPWDVSSASYATKYKYTGNEDTEPNGLFFKYDGMEVYIAGNSTDTVYQYTFKTPPTVTISAVTDINETTATGNGEITAIGDGDATKRGVCWNTTGNPDVTDSKSEQSGTFGIGTFSRPMTGLLRGEKYYVKAYAFNVGGYGYSDEVDFYTYPAVTTNEPTDIVITDPTTVTANGLIDVNVEGSITTRGFKYGLTEADTWNESESDSYSGGAFSLTITGLTHSTTYYIRAYAVGPWGTKYGSYVEFKTYTYSLTKGEVRAEATASSGDITAVGGSQSLLINNHLIQTSSGAQIVADSYLVEYKDQKTKLTIIKPVPPPYEIGDTIERISTGLAGQDMIIRKLNISFDAGNYTSVIELEG